MVFNPTPEAPAYIETKSGQYVAYTLCPICGDTHKHGAGPVSGPPDLGYRESHCLTGEGGAYRLVPGLSEKPRGLSDAERTRLLLAEDHRRGLLYSGAA